MVDDLFALVFGILEAAGEVIVGAIEIAAEFVMKHRKVVSAVAAWTTAVLVGAILWRHGASFERPLDSIFLGGWIAGISVLALVTGAWVSRGTRARQRYGAGEAEQREHGA